MAVRRCSSLRLNTTICRPSSLLIRYTGTTTTTCIPGPPKCPQLGSFQDIMDRNGGSVHGLDKQMMHIQTQYYNEFGKVLSMSQPGMGDYVVAHEPRDFVQLYRAEGKYPAGIVQQLWQLKQYCEMRSQNGVGEFFTQGEAWKRLRSRLASDLMQPKSARAYLPHINRVVEQACESFGEYEGNLDSFVTLLAFDMFTAVSLGTFLQSTNKCVAKPENLKFVRDAQNAFEIIGQMMFANILAEERLTHPLWFKFVVAMDASQERSHQLVNEVLEALESGTADDMQKDCYLAKLVERNELTKDEIVQIVMLLLQAGVDTTASVANWLLINIAGNTRVQRKLREEILSVCPVGDVTEAHLKQMPYLKACIRESHRLTPAVRLGTMRPAPADMIMSGYEIPKGTLIMTDNHCIQNDADLVDRVDDFWPERWSEEEVLARKGTEKAVCDHALLRDSFGMGARSCLGQRVAKLEIQVATVRLVREWSLELQPNQSWEPRMTPFLKADPFPSFQLSRAVA